MPTQKQYDVTLQNVRQIDCKIAVLNYDYTLIDEISGLTTSISLDVNADSDIRRTANVAINLKDDILQNQNHAFYWTAGNVYWFDKYIQIYTAIKDVRTDTYVWVNQGIYCINAPSIKYDATSNELSFQAVDLVAKMTGMRNGQMQGSATTVPADVLINSVIEDILLEQGFTKYILYDPPQARTVEDINIDADGTVWDLLTQLRDINSNWEMFFDVDGVFHSQQIPNGKVITSETSSVIEDDLCTNANQDIVTNNNVKLEILTTAPVEYTYGEPLPLVDDKIWDVALIDASYETNFENVKNYVEVYGKQHEPSEVAKAVQPPGAGYINLTLNKDREKYVNGTWCIEFDIGDDLEPTMLSTYIYMIYIYDASNSASPWFSVGIADKPITMSNESYCVKMTVGPVTEVVSGEFLGYMQPRGYAFENNPQSPFYVGQITRYTCALGTDVDFASGKEAVITSVDAIVNSSTMIVDLRPWISASDYSNADPYTEWYFRVNVDLLDDTPITAMAVRLAGTTVSTGIYDTDRQLISLDFSQDYMIVIRRSSSSTPTSSNITMLYYPTEASSMSIDTLERLNAPQFNNQVRVVLAGGEYDNIYSNDLARQRAKYEIYLRSRLHDNITIKCLPIYWLDVNQIIEYKLPNSESKESDYWLVKSVDTEVSVDGTQTINAMRYYSEYA